jgi:hypothetical protein
MGENSTWWQQMRSSVMDSSGKKKKKLFTLVASNNRIYADVISKLRLLDRKRCGALRSTRDGQLFPTSTYGLCVLLLRLQTGDRPC